MKKYITLITIFIYTIMSNAQNNERPEPINISNILFYDQFQAIKQFVVDQGQTRTYCQMYNNNPYYEFRDGNNDRIELYLDPILQFLNEEDKGNPNRYDNSFCEVHYKGTRIL